MEPEKLLIRPSQNGTGVFAACDIQKGALVWNWSDCRRYRSSELPDPYEKDGYLQVGPDTYLGPDGSPDGSPKDAGDYVNHSCEPNAEIKVDLPLVILVAKRDIRAGEEIGCDYAATMKNDPWTMVCNCATASCRGTVKELTKRTRRKSRGFSPCGVSPSTTT